MNYISVVSYSHMQKLCEAGTETKMELQEDACVVAMRFE